MLKAHLVRLTKGWQYEDALWYYLDYKPELGHAIGFDDIPTRSTFWKAWKKRLDKPARIALRITANTLVQIARQHDVSAPAKAFQPTYNDKRLDSPNAGKPSLRKFTQQKTEELWRQIQPYVKNSYRLLRGPNSSVKEEAFWEGQAHIASSDEAFPETGLDRFAADTERETVHCGKHHRDTLSGLEIDQVRKYHRKATRKLLREAQQAEELPDENDVAIDITKSNALSNTKEIEGWDPDRDKCNVTDKWVLGYNDADDGQDPEINYYFQWAAIQIVDDHRQPFLDAIPVHRGLKRHVIVDELLKHSKDMIDINQVLMDKEFCGDRVKAVCRKHGVVAKTPQKKHSQERATCRRLRQQRKKVHVEQREVNVSDDFLHEILEDDDTVDLTVDELRERLTTYFIYLPAKSEETWEERVTEIEEDIDRARDPIHPQDVRDEGDFKDLFTNRDEPPQPINDVLDEIQRDEEKQKQQQQGQSWEDQQLYSIFSTGSEEVPDSSSDLDKDELLRRCKRIIDPYSARWEIEEAWKFLKIFRAHTKSKKHRFRFFNFIFGLTLYNLWKMVDYLAKLAYFDEIPDKTIVTRGVFLTHAKQAIEENPPT